MQVLKPGLKRLLDNHPGLKFRLRALKWRFSNNLEVELRLLPFIVPRGRGALDVGGNVGLYTQALLPLASKVTVMEPNPRLAGDLRAGFGSRIALVEAAASDQSGRTTLHLPKDTGLGGLATIAPSNPLLSSDTHAVDVATKRIDELGLNDIGFIKIDVEGHELAAIDGGMETIRASRPIMLIEAEDRHRAGAVRSLRERLEPIGYRGFMIFHGTLASIERFDVASQQTLQPGQAALLDRGVIPPNYVNNFVFMPI
jgi:FkbM family methyltransferase